MALERTLSIIKPDAVAKNVIGQIYARFEAAGLKVVAARMVHLSRGGLQPPGEHVRSEVAIVSELARAALGADHPVPWEEFRADYDRVRDAIAAVVPGCAEYNRKVRQPDGFQLPHPPREFYQQHRHAIPHRIGQPRLVRHQLLRRLVIP